MPKRSSKKTEDANEIAFRVVHESTHDQQEVTPVPAAPLTKNPAAVALGRMGGKKGGLARAESLSPEQRKKIAQDAARARWDRRTDKGETA
jgi:hypothetical protein